MRLPSRDLVFAVDGGGTKTNTALLDGGGRVLATARGGACNLYQAPDAGLAEIRTCWHTCCATLGLDATDAAGCTISAGLAGVTAAGAPERFAAAFQDFGQALLSSDGYIALVGAFGAEPGAMVSIGTGVVGVRFNAAGEFRQLGGWGFPSGDAGGGAWIGLELVRAWLEHRDGVAPVPEADPLWRAVEAEVGQERSAVLAHLAGARPAVFAALAPLVIAAEDAFSAALLSRAAGHVAALAIALREHDVVLGGGLAPSLAPLVAPRLGGHGIRLSDRPADPLLGACMVAIGIRPPQFPHHPA
jgi:glucosamine kinase